MKYLKTLLIYRKHVIKQFFLCLFCYSFCSILRANPISFYGDNNQQKHKIKNLKIKPNTTIKMETITLGAGCFWCVEGVFQRIKGVLKVSSGYSGGKSLNPTYEKVCGPYNDHVEVCQIVYDPSIISTKELLRVFFYTHDPTTINKQGNDIGYQYRSVIFYHSQEQKEIALKKIDELMNGGFFLRSIVTTVEPLAKFYPAEAYHQNYYNDNPQQPYCKAIIKPKLDKLKKLFKDQLK